MDMWMVEVQMNALFEIDDSVHPLSLIRVRREWREIEEWTLRAAVR